MPLFVDRVGTLPDNYQIHRAAYFDPPSSPPREHIFLNSTSLSPLKLAYDPKVPHKTCTLWEYALRSAHTFASLTDIKKKVGEAVERAVREDSEFWDTLRDTGDKIIIFEDSHWFWGRHRPGLGEHWSGRNEMGELLMLVRESYKSSLARLMPLEPFPLSPSPSTNGHSIPAAQAAGLQAPPRRPVSASMFGRERPLSVDLDGMPSAPFSRLVNGSSSSNGRSSRSYPHPPPFGPDDLEVSSPRLTSGLPSLGAPFPRSMVSSPLPPLLSLDVPMYQHRSPAPSISSTRTPPPPYSSQPASPAMSFDFRHSPMSLLPPPPPPRTRTSGMYRPALEPTVRSNGMQTHQTLPHRLRGINVNEDMEMRALNRLREEFQNKDRLELDNVAELRAFAARRTAQQDAARASRYLRDIQRAHIASDIALAKRQMYGIAASRAPYVPESLRKADELGARRTAEIEAKLVAHRRAMRDIQETRRDRELDQIERLAGRGRVRLEDEADGLPPRDRRYSMPLY